MSHVATLTPTLDFLRGRTPSERVVMSLLNISSSIPAIIASYRMLRNGLYYEGIMSICMFISASSYHMCEVIEPSPDASCFCGLSELEWHVLDNIFAITCIQSVNLFLMNNSHDMDEILRWSFFVLTVFLQFRWPWQLWATLLPIFLAFACLLARFAFFLSSHRLLMERLNDRSIRRCLMKGAGLLGIGMLFFLAGLDDHSDYLRWRHFVWHVFASSSALYIFHPRYRLRRVIGDTKLGDVNFS